MEKLLISERDIESVEKLLLPMGAHFAEDARDVIRCWHSTDVIACPGSGKTTVLLAKIKLLADRMPLDNGTGICVLSHTNVAVDEIKTRLSCYADELLSYPNFIGTIQSFVDRFVTTPYLRRYYGRDVQFVDDMTYAQHMLSRMQKEQKYNKLNYVTNCSFKSGGQFLDRIAHTQSLFLREDGSLCVGKQRRALAGKDKESTIQYRQLIDDLIKIDGIMKYREAYQYIDDAVNELTEEYVDLFSLRFQYVFIDEYQDCDEVQREALQLLFNPDKCTVIRIGDTDQAIYNSESDTVDAWIPKEGYLSISSSNRFGQEIADVISELRQNHERILSHTGKINIKPVLLVYDVDKIDRVIEGFINALEMHGLCDPKGIYKAIGAVKKEDTSGLKIGSYWKEFNDDKKNQSDYNYWSLIGEIRNELINGKMYNVERIFRRLLCRILHYARSKSSENIKDYTVTSIKRILEEDYNEIYRDRMYALSQLNNLELDSINEFIKGFVNEMLEIKNPGIGDIFDRLPVFFTIPMINYDMKIAESNVYVEPTRGRRIEFSTVHGVKGETHDATLYLETERHGSSDLKRILPYFGVGKVGSSSMFEYSRKLAYVGMSRPRYLLCVAMKSETYEKSNGVFDKSWEIIDLRVITKH